MYHGPLVSSGTTLRFGDDAGGSSSADSACRPLRPKSADVDEHEMVVGPAGDDRARRGHQPVGEGRGVVDDRGRIVAANDGCDASASATALAAITWGSGPPRTSGTPAVDELGELVRAQHEPAARTAQGLVRRRRDDVRVRHGVVVAGEHLAGDETRRSAPCRP